MGYRLLEQALVFGGQTLTASDVAVAAGYAQMGDSSLAADLPRETVDLAVAEIHRMLAEGVDRMKTSADPVPLILVGGGSVLISEDIPGVSEVIVPESAAVANAVGASIALAGGEVDTVYSYEAIGRDAAMESAREQAEQAAIDAGARPGTVKHHQRRRDSARLCAGRPGAAANEGSGRTGAAGARAHDDGWQTPETRYRRGGANRHGCDPARGRRRGRSLHIPARRPAIPCEWRPASRPDPAFGTRTMTPR